MVDLAPTPGSPARSKRTRLSTGVVLGALLAMGSLLFGVSALGLHHLGPDQHGAHSLLVDTAESVSLSCGDASGLHLDDVPLVEREPCLVCRHQLQRRAELSPSDDVVGVVSLLAGVLAVSTSAAASAGALEAPVPRAPPLS